MQRLMAILGAILYLCLTSPTLADTLVERMAFWRKQAFVCTDVSGKAFPSKEQALTGYPPTTCDDGDMTLFNGLLCSVGEQAGCDAVVNSQDVNGRWWRSPRRIGMEYVSGRVDVSFSADQSRGALLYALTKNDPSRLAAYANWIMQHRPCLVDIGGCRIYGWPRLCTDDASDLRCTFRPWTCVTFQLAGKRLSVASADVCGAALKLLKLDVPDFFFATSQLEGKVAAYASGSAVVNDPGYPLHLAAVDLFILERLGYSAGVVKAGGAILAAREPLNPFFQYLAGADTAKITELVMDECPSSAKPSRSKFQWSWEREMSTKPWEDSMYWDCIFIGRLLGAP
ncbi:hypothetical protein ACC764_29450 [Rhizobium ruizarguesonis]|uniref:hypothetical protein n=1 Tax=Rhizobium ruizarguesonis TaxID=2081791 RepID=UPI002E0FCA7E|nr:hypothetical protein U8Q07_04640 [Rhizobium ruizarguesonis]WSH34607.1 hypothetical protein U8P70_04635 [Rhizobium ruizarguesonis]WSH58741.1 hypothetical protein U8P68_04605 [Rhizobium ruizarguesonis]